MSREALDFWLKNDPTCPIKSSASYLRKDMKKSVAAVALAAAGLSLAACSSAAPHPVVPDQPSSYSTTAPVQNPVTILRETGADIPAGTVKGEYNTGLGGYWYADGNFYGPGCTKAENCSEQVTVYALPAGMTPAQFIAQSNVFPDDSHGYVTGSNFVIEVTGVGVTGSMFFVPAAVVAERVHGQVVS